jgi:hypothetical protein
VCHISIFFLFGFSDVVVIANRAKPLPAGIYTICFSTGSDLLGADSFKIHPSFPDKKKPNGICCGVAGAVARLCSGGFRYSMHQK